MHTFEQAQAMRYYRQRFSDMPVGDALSGAAYGEYLKSKGLGAVIGVVAAVASVWTGGASLAAMGAITSANIGAAISAGAMVAGGVMSGVGAVTGNKKLAKIGGVMALAGGLGSLAFGSSTRAGLLSDSAFKAGDGANLATGATPTESLVKNLTEVASDKTPAFKAPTGLDVNTAPNMEIGASSGSTSTGYDLGSGLADAGGKVPSNTMSTAGTNLGSGLGDAGGVPSNLTSNLGTSVAGGGGGGGGSGLLNQAGDAITGIGKFAKDNKELIEIGGKMLMGAGEGTEGNEQLQGAKSALAEAQATAANATARNTDSVTEANKAKMAAEEQQRKNANTQIVMLDPRDPQYAQKKAEAAAKGIPTMDMVTPASGPVTMGNVDYTKSANQWVPIRPSPTGMNFNQVQGAVPQGILRNSVQR